MQREDIDSLSHRHANVLNNTIIAAVSVAVVAFLVIFVRKRRRQAADDAGNGEGEAL